MKTKFIFFFVLLSLLSLSNYAQNQNNYHPSATKVFDLVHTKLKISLDIPNQKLNGQAWITLHPHFYPSDSVQLNAKSMEIQRVKLDNGKNLNYDYDGQLLTIKLNKVYNQHENVTIQIDYNLERFGNGTAYLQDENGLFFINPKGTDPNLPIQVWTHGETQTNSSWFPTIDQPNQRTSQELYLTFPDKYVSLSNGRLVSSTSNLNNQTRTDYWKQDKNHPPYLFFLCVGDYAIVKDKWKHIPVNYYVEKAFESNAKDIFGTTPEMIEFFSNLLNYPYPWDKYCQITAHNFVSGAMENTSAVLHHRAAQQVSAQLIDENSWESTIAHELFHHWFGNLVTTESWANLSLNESFANYSEYLWFEHKYGIERAEAHKLEEKLGYLRDSSDYKKKLVRFDYKNKDEMFDAVTYNKGGLVLHMLRNYLGDKAFFEGLSLYLKTKEFDSAEAHELRLALEKVSGKDLNWFFNQWFYGFGHPILNISTPYDPKTKTLKVSVEQCNAKKFQFPLRIDIFNGSSSASKEVWIDAKEVNEFMFKVPSEPNLVNINPSDIVLCQIQHNKTMEQLAFQYEHSKDFYSRISALKELGKFSSKEKAVQTILKAAKNDPSDDVRIAAIESLNLDSTKIDKIIDKALIHISKKDKKTLVQAKALNALAELDFEDHQKLFEQMFRTNSSYAIQSACLEAILEKDKQRALELVNQIPTPNYRSDLGASVAKTRLLNSDYSNKYLSSSYVLRLLLHAESQLEANHYLRFLNYIMAGDFPSETCLIAGNISKLYKMYSKYPISKNLLGLIERFHETKKKKLATDPLNISLAEQVKLLQTEIQKIKNKGNN